MIALWISGGWAAALHAQPASCNPVVNTGSNHSILLLNLNPTLNGAPLPTGSYITVLYDDNGVLKCAGYTQWMGANTAIAAFGDDNTTPQEKDGLDANEIFRYRVELPGGNTVGPACITVQYASGGIFSNAGSFAENGISGLSAFEARTADCPNLCLNIGDYCDDNDDSTLNDMVTANCTCEGVAVATTIRPFVVANAGAYQTAGVYSLAWTLGQIAGETLDTIAGADVCYWLRQGFQQPFEWLPPEPFISCFISTFEHPGETIGFQVFPNPFSGTITVAFEKAFPHVLSVSTPDGRTVYALESNDSQDRPDLGSLPAGMYFLTIADTRHGASQVIKLIKY